MTKNENTTHLSFWNAAKVVFKEKIITIMHIFKIINISNQ